MENKNEETYVVNPKHQVFLGLALANLHLELINRYEFNIIVSKHTQVVENQEKIANNPLATDEEHAEEISADLLSDEVLLHFFEDLLGGNLCKNAANLKLKNYDDKFAACKKAIDDCKKEIPDDDMSMIISSGNKIIDWLNTLEAYNVINKDEEKTLIHLFQAGVQILYEWIFKATYPIFNIERRAMERNAAEKRHPNVIQFIN